MAGTRTPRSPQINRRELMSGARAGGSADIASVLVQARPERMAEVEQAIVSLAGCEIHGRDARGKLVVVIEAPDAGTVGATLNAIALLPDVLSANLVFHAIDAGANGDPETAS
jgi:periplasmic nitrate reductase NapD